MEERDSFGTWLRRKRKARDWTQADLADRVGCSAALIRKIEAEERRPSDQIAGKLADIFQIPAKDRAMFHKFSRGDSHARFSEPGAETHWAESRPTLRSNLPWPVTSLVGREQDIANLREYLSNPAIRLVTLVGPPGIGKTRLSIAAGRDVQTAFPDGVFFIPLVQIEDAADSPADAPAAIASLVLKILDFDNTGALPAHQQLAKGILEKKMLLILDNCEHVITSVAVLLVGLLPACPNLKILGTSRETLRVMGEWLYPMQSLVLPEETSLLNAENLKSYSAPALFTERARAVSPGFSLDSNNAQAVASLCALVDGLPLGIELIAARSRLFSPQALLTRFDTQSVLSADGRRPESQRQKSLQHAINWSYELLSPQEQRLFAYLSVFAGGFPLSAADRLVQHLYGSGFFHEPVASLVEKSLVQFTQDSWGMPRFGLLRTIHQFASNCLEQMEAKSAAQNWHLEFYIALVEHAEQSLHGPNQLGNLNIVESDYENIRAALNWSIASHKTEPAVRLLLALDSAWMMRGHTREWMWNCEKARQLSEVKKIPYLYAQLLNRLGRINALSGNGAYARSLLEESGQIALALGGEGERELAYSQLWQGFLAMISDSNYALAKSLVQSSLAYYQKAADAWSTAHATYHLGVIEMIAGHDEPAQFFFEKCLTSYRGLGDQEMIARGYFALQQIFMRLGDDEKASQCFQQHITIDTQLQYWNVIEGDLRDLGLYYRSRGKYEQANALLDDSLAVCEAHGIDQFESLAMSAVLALEWSNVSLAYQRFTRLLSSTWKAGEQERLYFPLAGIASLAVSMSQPERAALLFGAVKTIADQPMYNNSNINLQVFDQYAQNVRDQLGEELYAALETKGCLMRLEEAVDFALERPEGTWLSK